MKLFRVISSSGELSRRKSINAIKEAILDGIIANEKKEAYQFLIKKAAEIGLKPKK